MLDTSRPRPKALGCSAIPAARDVHRRGVEAFCFESA